MANLVGDSMNPNVAAVFGNNTVGTAVFGVSTSGAGVAGRSQSGLGVYANSSTNTALYAEAGSGGEAPAVLVVKQMGGGYLINGLDRGRNRVFEVSAMGGVSIAGGIGVGRSIFVQNEINAGGDIRTNGDVFARGVKLTCDKNAKENFSSVTLARSLRISTQPSDLMEMMIHTSQA
ncbi:hypothetical protein [Bacillus tropicus]|uniref:hypothetical protein n=1 Tax=Bacillus tropicus TaxID=2026188 RepID=UPI00307F705E